MSAVQMAQRITHTASRGTRRFRVSDTLPSRGAVTATSSADMDSAKAKLASVPPASSVTHRGKKNVSMLAENMVSEKS